MSINLDQDATQPTQSFAIAAAVNSEDILAQCLARSPDIRSGALTLRVYRNQPSAAIAYNRAIDEAGAGVTLILAHQDVYLPSGWAKRLDYMLATLSRDHPDWMVAGLVGKTARLEFVGHVWSTGMDMELCGVKPLPCEIECLDELLIVVRGTCGLRFDERLPGFHLYGLDIVQEAKRLGGEGYVIEAPAIHHDKAIPKLDKAYAKAWRYAKRKWGDRLPLPTLIVPLDNQPFRLLTGDIRLRRGIGGGRARIAPESDPRQIARRLGWEAYCDSR